MIRETFILTVRNLLDDVYDEENILVHAMELMEELYALIDRPSKYRRQLIRDWGLAKVGEIDSLCKQLSTDMGILEYLDSMIALLVEQGQIKYRSARQ